MNDAQRETLLNIVKEFEDKYSSFLRYIENDPKIPEESFRQIDDNSSEISYYITLLKEYLI